MNSGSTEKLDKMDDKRFRFTEKEKSVLFTLFKQYQDVIDIRHRRYSQSHHKQAALRNCWNKILEEFNASPDTGNRSMKQIQKFWLNSKLRNRLPSSDGKQKKESNANKVSKSGDAAYRELAKSCKVEDDDDDDDGEEEEEVETITADAQGDQTHEIEVVNVADTFDGHYDNLNESYFENNGEAITLKVIDNQINYALPTPSATSLVAIPQGGQVNATLVTVPTSEINKKTSRSLSNPSNNGTTYIAYSQIKDNNSSATDNQNVHSTRSYVLTSSANATPTTATNRNISIHQSPQENETNVNDSILFELQRQEMELKVREAKMRLEIQEMEKEKQRQELIHMREIHCLKIKEMEQRLRNIERS